MKYLFILLFLYNTPFAQALSPYELSDEELNPQTQEILINKPEKYLRHESMIYNLNTDLGIKDQRKYTATDGNRLSLAGHVSSDYEHFRDLFGFEFNYMHRTKRYHQIWYGIQFFQHQTFFDAITQNQTPSSGDNANDESQFQRPGDTKNKILGVGLGLGYRFKLLMDFFPTTDVFETIDVFANYIMMDETFINKTYRGYGLTTNYGIHKRSGKSFFYGGKISYNLASVSREALGTESKSDRSLALGWLSLALELGIFY